MPNVKASIPEGINKKLITGGGEADKDKARNDAADALFMITQNEEMLMTNWSCPTKELEDVVLRMKERFGLNVERLIA